VIVVYLDFPRISTIGTIHALRVDQRITDIPIIVFLPWKDDEGALAALEAGADDVLQIFKICAACANFSETENSDSDIHLAKTPRAPSSELLFPFAAFASLREIFRDLAVALPR
jgi:CheY-like chemotaxis protein